MIYLTKNHVKARQIQSLHSQRNKNLTIILWQVRILVENAISGIKRFNILVHAFRNHKDGMEDDSIVLAAGLWNFLLLKTI